VKSLLSSLLITARCFAALTGLVLVGCSSGPTVPPAPATLPSTLDYTYIIGPGDGLNVTVWRNPELSMTVTVRPDGKVSAPLVDELWPRARRPVQLAREVEKVLGKYVRDPSSPSWSPASSGPTASRSASSAKPPSRSSCLQEQDDLLDVMIAVGGLTDFASGNKATILRTAEGNKQYSVRLQDLLKRGDVSANVEMRPGDILIIPQSLF
jgi:polysaccharide export outer membrane protein